LLDTNTKTREFKFDSSHYIKALFELMKPRVMSLAIFTCVVGFLIAPYKSVDYLYAILSITAVALGSGAAGSLNCWYESDVDKLMSRTCLRPIPTGRLTRKEALSPKNTSLYFNLLLETKDLLKSILNLIDEYSKSYKKE